MQIDLDDVAISFEIDTDSIAEEFISSDDFGQAVKEVLEYELDYEKLGQEASEHIVHEVTTEDFDDLKSEIEELKEELQNAREAIQTLDELLTRHVENRWWTKIRDWVKSVKS